MKIRQLVLFFSLSLAILIASGCRSQFERVRTSTDPVLILDRANNYYEEEEYQKAQTLYELVVAAYRGTAEAEMIAFRYAYTFYHNDQFILASYYFKTFANTYGASNLREEADFMAAYSNYRLSPIFRLDQTYTEQAIDGFEEFANRYPTSPRVEESNSLIDEMRSKLELKDFEAAKLYIDLRRYQAAIQSLDNLLKEYPETRRAEQIRFMATKAAYDFAQASFVELQRDRYEEAVERAEYFLRRYPESEQRDDVNQFLERANARINELQDVRYQSQGSRS
ncbi:MAG: outer membrane protein assembly factor BamD [Bacteroidota bacterium]